MNPQLIDEILDELDPIFQNTDASAGIVRLLKDKGIVKDDELAPYLEQSATAGSIKWRATRLRLARLLESAIKAIEEELEEKQKKAIHEAKAPEQQPREPSGTPPAAQETPDPQKPERNEVSSETKAPTAPAATASPDQNQSSAGSSQKPSEANQPGRSPTLETRREGMNAEPADDAKKRESEAGRSTESKRRPA
jgi:hypothetical protein